MINFIKIDAINYDVEESNGPLIVNGKECGGEIDYLTTKIKILNSLSKEKQKWVLMHEIMHGIMYERHLEDNKTTDETVLDELASAFIALIRDNPELIKLLKE